MEIISIWLITNSAETIKEIADNIAKWQQDTVTYQLEKFNAENLPIADNEHKLPDVILLDWDKMKCGLDLIERYKINENTTHIPILLISEATNLSVAFEKGANDVIEKPITENRFKLRIEINLRLSKYIKEVNIHKDKIRIQSEELEKQKEVSDRLLLNILPYEIAEQLKKKGQAKTKQYKLVTVMFTDFKDFSKYANTLSPQDLVDELSLYIQSFDEIIEQHYIEKIKTIGDAYMCAGGLPLKNRSNPFDVILAAFKINQFMQEQKRINQLEGKTLWECRIGIHTGEVVAGVIGKRKFAYDIWGDTVNTASRMESNGEVNKINISGDTYENIKEFFECTYRGKINVKNKGEIDMYFVERLKPEYSEDEEGLYPNDNFNKMLAKL